MSDPEKGSNRPETQPKVPTLEDLTRWGLSWIHKNADKDLKLLPVVKRGRVEKAIKSLEEGDFRMARILIDVESENLYQDYLVGSAYGEARGQSLALEGSPLANQSGFFTRLTVELDRKLAGEAGNEVRLRELGQLREVLRS